MRVGAVIVAYQAPDAQLEALLSRITAEVSTAAVVLNQAAPEEKHELQARYPQLHWQRNAANLGLSTSIEGDTIRVSVPSLTEERRKEYVKLMKDRSELARVAVRNARQKAIKDIPEEGVSEDEVQRMKDEIEDDVKKANDKIAELRDKKEEDLMTV